MSLLGDYLSSEDDDSANEDLIRAEHGVQNLSMSRRQCIDFKSEAANKSCLDARSANKQLLDFSTDDKCNRIIYLVPEDIDLSSRSTRKGEEFQEPLGTYFNKIHNNSNSKRKYFLLRNKC